MCEYRSRLILSAFEGERGCAPGCDHNYWRTGVCEAVRDDQLSVILKKFSDGVANPVRQRCAASVIHLAIWRAKEMAFSLISEDI